MAVEAEVVHRVPVVPPVPAAAETEEVDIYTHTRRNTTEAEAEAVPFPWRRVSTVVSVAAESAETVVLFLVLSSLATGKQTLGVEGVEAQAESRMAAAVARVLSSFHMSQVLRPL